MSIYNFTDTVAGTSQVGLPTEALMIVSDEFPEGEYIENLIDGYRTLTVKGRELMEQDVKSLEIGNRHGTTYQRRRYPERKITVEYQIITAGDTDEEKSENFREAFNTLNMILDFDEAKLIFADEPDKYFVGRVEDVGEIEPGRYAVKGEMTFVCNDPFKYSVTEHEINLTTDSEGNKMFVVDYQGTQPAYPVFETSFYQSDEQDNADGECGYVAFVNDRGNVLQFGDPAETDTVEGIVGEIEQVSHVVTDSETLVTEAFNSTTGWTVNQGWTVGGTNHVQTGTIKAAVFGSGTDKALQANSVGSGAKKWHGPSATKTIKSDSGNPAQTTHSNWEAYCSLMFATTSPLVSETFTRAERGVFQFYVLDSNKEYIAAVQVWKGSVSVYGKARCYVRGSGAVATWDNVDLSFYGPRFGYKPSSTAKARTRGISIAKSGRKIAFNVGGLKFVYTASAATGSAKAKYIGFYIAGYDTAPRPRMGVYSCSFKTKSRQRTVIDVPHEDIVGMVEQANTFNTNDILLVDCQDGTVNLKQDGEEESAGVETPSLGALGNEWESFCLAPGDNQIGFGYSDWVEDEYAPTAVLKYREVFL